MTVLDVAKINEAMTTIHDARYIPDAEWEAWPADDLGRARRNMWATRCSATEVAGHIARVLAKCGVPLPGDVDDVEVVRPEPMVARPAIARGQVYRWADGTDWVGCSMELDTLGPLVSCTVFGLGDVAVGDERYHATDLLAAIDQGWLVLVDGAS